MATKEYFITKLSFREDQHLIKDVFAYESDGQKLYEGEDHLRYWMVNRSDEGSKISIMYPDENGKWQRGNTFSYIDGYYSWGTGLPENITKRKTFVSYYHRDDQIYREKFENLFGDLIVSKSVQKGDIDSDNSDEYIKQLIQKGYLSDTAVLIVLLSPKTKCRMHVDWEISGALNYKVGEKYAGLLGIKLPSHTDFGTGSYTSNLLPARLSDNLKSGYAIIRDWTSDRVLMQSYIEEAFENRTSKEADRNNSRVQMDKDTCE